MGVPGIPGNMAGAVPMTSSSSMVNFSLLI